MKTFWKVSLLSFHFGHNGAFEDHGDARLCCEIVCNLSCDPLLQVERIESSKDEREESVCTDDDEDSRCNTTEGEECADVISVESTKPRMVNHLNRIRSRVQKPCAIRNRSSLDGRSR